MEVIIKTPSEISEKEMNEIFDLIDQGSQIPGDRATIFMRLKSAVLISFILDEGKIVSTATLKNPSDSYRKKVFKSANAESIVQMYKNELGYIVTAKNREGEKLCQKLLFVFFPLIAEYTIFATTRKQSMMHILGKFGFKVTGEKYNLDLSLLVN
jgi:predicted GNAT family N-acyltransferase